MGFRARERKVLTNSCLGDDSFIVCGCNLVVILAWRIPVSIRGTKTGNSLTNATCSVMLLQSYVYDIT